MPYQLKYRCLNDTELELLEGELKQFLVANGVYAEEWRDLNVQSPEKAQELVNLFSDLVFEKVLEQAEYLIHRTPSDLKVFQCGKKGMVLMGLKIDHPAVDLTQSPYKEDLASAIQEAGPAATRLYRAEKSYSAEREAELFDMMEQGCEITDGILFERLQSLYQA